MECHAYWLLKSSCFKLSGDRKYDLFLSKKVYGNMIFIDYWKVLVLNFSEMRNTVFFEAERWWKDYNHWLLKRSCFEIFGDGKYIFLSQKADGKRMFTWSFWAFHDIPGFEKHAFSCSVASLEWYRIYKLWKVIIMLFIEINPH